MFVTIPYTARCPYCVIIAASKHSVCLDDFGALP